MRLNLVFLVNRFLAVFVEADFGGGLDYASRDAKMHVQYGVSLCWVWKSGARSG